MITTWSTGPADECMPEAFLVEMLQTVRSHPWWHARASLAVAILRKWNVLPPSRIADVGCGWGTNLDALMTVGYRVSGLDISRDILELIDRPERDLIEVDLNQELPPAAHASFDACLLLDVIEHVDDDRAALERAAKLLSPTGICVVGVPAIPQLFSEFDRIQGHRRRYTRERLSEAFVDTGLIVEAIFWWGWWMIPVLHLMRVKDRARTAAAPRTYADYLRLPRWPGPQLMLAAYAFEKYPALRGWLPRGTSLFAIARASGHTKSG